jgi:photosystem II stability/assembly factor-like uncharacterized protein
MVNDAARNVGRLAIDPSRSATIYAGTFAGGVLKSNDGGASWTAINNGLSPSTYLNSLVIDPLTPATLYVGGAVGVFKSADGGASWTAANNGLPASANISSLAIDPQNPVTLYVGAAFAGIFKSTDGGATWQPTGAD